jgi:hypothetical protein
MNSVYATVNTNNGDNEAAIKNTSTCNSFYDELLFPPHPPPFTSKSDASILLQYLSLTCQSLPQCTIMKTQCANDPKCSECEQLIESGNTSGALAVCRPNSTSFADPIVPVHYMRLTILMTSCTSGTNVGCNFGTAACNATPGCTECYNQIRTEGVLQSMTDAANTTCSEFAGQLVPRVALTAINPDASVIDEYFTGIVLAETFELCPRDISVELDACEYQKLRCILHMGDVRTHHSTPATFCSTFHVISTFERDHGTHSFCTSLHAFLRC